MILRNFNFSFALLVVSSVVVSAAFTGGGGPFEKIQNDFLALTRRVTARHILVANEEVALALKRKIREQCIEKNNKDPNRFVIDVFEEAAKKYSQDDTTNYRGGLLGELVPQGYCKSQVLDRACFEVDLGQLEGPIESEFGYHILLVSERTNCPKLDGKKTKLVQTTSDDSFGSLVPSKQVGSVTPTFVVQQVLLWVWIFFAGGILAEVLSRFVPNG